MDITPLHPLFVGEVTGLDLREAIGAVRLAELTAAIDEKRGLKKRPDKVIVELTAANDPRSPRPETRIVQIIRQPTLLCWSGAPASFEQDVWTETHPQG